jgi:hypothetical protein
MGTQYEAHICGCKSRREFITTDEVKRNCMRMTECGKDVLFVNCEPICKNRMEGTATNRVGAMRLRTRRCCSAEWVDGVMLSSSKT